MEPEYFENKTDTDVYITENGDRFLNILGHWKKKRSTLRSEKKFSSIEIYTNIRERT